MIHSLLTPRAALIGLSASLLSVALVGCGSKNEPNIDTAPATTNAAAPDAVAKPADFASASATWTKIEAAKADLDKVVASKNLKTVHEAAFKVRDIVKTLPAQSSALPADKMATLNTQVKNVEQLAGKLDESGDANNLSATQENQAGLSDTLDTIKGLYPAGTFR